MAEFETMRKIGDDISNTAILIFTNTSKAEVDQKGILNGEDLFDALTERTLKTVEKSGIPYLLITEKHQQGNSFGERFTNAIQHIFDLGYENVITLGNDSPGLTKHHLLNALRLLSEGKSAVGPASDGGFYLLGIHRSGFSKNQLLNLPWQTRGLYAALLKQAAERKVEFEVLSVLQDIDSEDDIRLLLGRLRLKSKHLNQLLIKLLPRSRFIPLYQAFGGQNLFPTLNYNKGSPALLPW